MLSILTGLACGFNAYEYNLSFSRTFVFFPFFVLGHYKHAAIIQIIKNHKINQFIAFGVFTVIFLVLLMIFENYTIDKWWLFGSRSYSTLGVQWEYGVVYRLSLYALASILGVALLLATSRVRRFYTAYGEDTLYILSLIHI